MDNYIVNWLVENNARFIVTDCDRHIELRIRMTYHRGKETEALFTTTKAYSKVFKEEPQHLVRAMIEEIEQLKRDHDRKWS